MKRSAIRELAFRLIYSLEIQKENLDEQLEIYFENEEITKQEIKEYISRLKICIFYILKLTVIPIDKAFLMCYNI